MARRERTDYEQRALETAAMEFERISAACEVFFSCNDHATEEDAWHGVPAMRKTIRAMSRIQALADDMRETIARVEGV